MYAPISLAILAQEFNIHYTYLGTGCIFDYDESHTKTNKLGYLENSTPNFFGSNYSIVKGFTDRLISLLDKNTLNLRIRMPISQNYNERNFITKITSYKKICSVPNSMSVLPFLLPKILNLMSDKVTGTINFTNPGVISHN